MTLAPLDFQRSSVGVRATGIRWSYWFFKWAIPGLFFFIFGLSKQTIQGLQQINGKNIHLVCGAGIWTHDLLNMGLLP